MDIFTKLHSFFNKIWGNHLLTDTMLIVAFPIFIYFTINQICAFLYRILSMVIKIKIKADYKEAHISINEEIKNNV